MKKIGAAIGSIAVLAAIVAVYNVAKAVAYVSVVPEMQKRSANQCLSGRSSSCVQERTFYVTCPEKVKERELDYWWNHRGEAVLQSIFDERYAAYDYDFEKIKEWSACKGLLIAKQFNSMNVSSPSKYGFTMFGNSLPGLTHGSTLKVKPLPDNKIQVRVNYTYL